MATKKRMKKTLSKKKRACWWNHRVFVQTYEHPGGEREEYYTIRETHYECTALHHDESDAEQAQDGMVDERGRAARRDDRRAVA